MKKIPFNILLMIFAYSLSIVTSTQFPVSPVIPTDLAASDDSVFFGFRLGTDRLCFALLLAEALLFLSPSPVRCRWRLFSCLLLLGLSVFVIIDVLLLRHWPDLDVFAATFARWNTKLAFRTASNGILQTHLHCFSQLGLVSKLPAIMLPYPCFAASLLLISGLNPNPGPRMLSSSDSSDSADFIPVSAANLPVIGSANVCGLRSKVMQLQAEFLIPFNFAAFAVQETKLPASCREPCLQIPDYTLFRKDRTASGGGVALYVQNALNPRRLRNKIPSALELVAVEAFSVPGG